MLDRRDSRGKVAKKAASGTKRQLLASKPIHLTLFSFAFFSFCLMIPKTLCAKEVGFYQEAKTIYFSNVGYKY